jgi:hypothetical protein
MTTYEPNLRVLKRSRKVPLPGDVFVLSPREGLFLFGRVIRTDLPRGKAPMPGAYLVYVYGHRSDDMQPDPAELRPDALLLPPLFINRMPWTKGYLHTVANWPLTDDELVEQHCFRRAGPERYFDEERNELPGPSEPCGDWALYSYASLDDRVSDALGMERAPE